MKSAKPTVDQPSRADAERVELPMNTGQIEQVVSSADCRSAHRSETDHSVVPEHIQRISVGGAAAKPSRARESAEPVLDLESRLLVALAGRGEQRIGQVIVGALTFADGRLPHDLYGLPDESLVRFIEEFVFYDVDDEGFASPPAMEPRASRRGPDGTEGGE